LYLFNLILILNVDLSNLHKICHIWCDNMNFVLRWDIIIASIWWLISAISCIHLSKVEGENMLTYRVFAFDFWGRRHEDTIYFRRNSDILIGEDTISCSVKVSCLRVEIFVSAAYFCRVIASKRESQRHHKLAYNISYLRVGALKSRRRRHDMCADFYCSRWGNNTTVHEDVFWNI
jgi:hypothetical protein